MKKMYVDPLPGHETAAVFGLGASGIAAAKLLASFHKTVIASDSADASRRAEFESKLPEGTRLVLGHNEIGTATVIVTSPGLEPSTPIFEEARARHIPVIAELELAARATRCPIVAITGTDGKTTTTTLIGHILDKCGVDNRLGGNVGIPFAEVVPESGNVDCFVIETSAFQLAFCPEFHPRILVATNIAEDHNEYFHGDRDRYVSTKRHPLTVMGTEDLAILNASDPEVRGWDACTRARICWYAEKLDDIPPEAIDYAHVGNDALRIHYNGYDYSLPLEKFRLRGAHNAMNALGAICAALGMGCEFDEIVAAMDSYVLPHHRIEFVCEHGGVRFIDDSKATNPHAGMAALASVMEPMVLIVGGVDKGLNLKTWIGAMRENVRHIMVIGELTERFCADARDAALQIPLHCVDSLETAVSDGYRYACESDCRVVMLSPGCSSYDMFRSYAMRGEAFCAAAKSLV